MKKVLVVEDDPKISRVLELELSHEGYITKVVDDGYDALVESEFQARCSYPGYPDSWNKWERSC